MYKLLKDIIQSVPPPKVTAAWISNESSGTVFIFETEDNAGAKRIANIFNKCYTKGSATAEGNRVMVPDSTLRAPQFLKKEGYMSSPLYSKVQQEWLGLQNEKNQIISIPDTIAECVLLSVTDENVEIQLKFNTLENMERIHRSILISDVDEETGKLSLHNWETHQDKEAFSITIKANFDELSTSLLKRNILNEAMCEELQKQHDSYINIKKSHL